MNYLLLSRYLGTISIIIGLLMLPAALWAVYFKEWLALVAIGEAVSISLAFGGILAVIGRNAPRQLYQREALALVGITWIIAAGLGALPFVFAGVLGPVDAYFESMSGFTTTGSSVLTDIEGAPKSILFWRSFTHWLGGLGIVILFIAVLPYLGVGGKHLFVRESTGPDPRVLRPRTREAVLLLYKIYIGLTVLGTLAFMAGGMDLFDGLCHCFAALATGGYSTRQASIAAYHSLFIEIVAIVIMLMGATSFGLYAELLKGNWREVLRDTEFRFFLGVFLVGTILVTFNLLGMGLHVEAFHDSALRSKMAAQELESIQGPEGLLAPVDVPRTRYGFGRAVRSAAFQVTSCMTDTGYATDNFDLYPYLSRLLLMMVAITGGCAGSTAGGLKMVRVVVLIKILRAWIERAFEPRTVRAIRVNGQPIEEGVQQRICAFFVFYFFWLGFACLLLSVFGLPLDSAVSAAIATVNNLGPGLEFVGPGLDFHLVPIPGKLFLCLNMLVGRLEFVSVLALFTPGFWRKR